ncbi:hypothetical protein GEMRC1_013460 [Eukaryota sp. GEM-RC1]
MTLEDPSLGIAADPNESEDISDTDFDSCSSDNVPLPNECDSDTFSSDSEYHTDSDDAGLIPSSPKPNEHFSDDSMSSDETIAALLGTADLTEFTHNVDSTPNLSFLLLDHIIGQCFSPTSSQKPCNISTSPYSLEGPPLPSNFHQFSEHLAQHLMIRSILPNNVRLTVRVTNDTCLKSLVDKLWNKFKRTNPEYDFDPKEWAVKVSGHAEFLIGNSPLFHYSSIFDVLLASPAILDLTFVSVNDFYSWYSFFSSHDSVNQNHELFDDVMKCELPPNLTESVNNCYSTSMIRAPLRMKIKGLSNIFASSSKLLSKLNKMKGPDELKKSNIFLFGIASVYVGDRSLTSGDFCVLPLSSITEEFVFFPDDSFELVPNISNIPTNAKLAINFFALTRPPDVDDSWVSISTSEQSVSINPLHRRTTSSSSNPQSNHRNTQSKNDLWFEQDEFHLEDSSNSEKKTISLKSLASTVLKSLLPVPTRSFVHKQKKHAPPPFVTRVVKVEGISIAPVFGLSMPLFNENLKLVEGVVRVFLWADTVADHVKGQWPAPSICHGRKAPQVILEFDRFDEGIVVEKAKMVEDVLLPNFKSFEILPKSDDATDIGSLNAEDSNELTEILNKSTLFPPSRDDARILWKYRESKVLQSCSSGIIKLFQIIDFSSKWQTNFAMSLLKIFKEENSTSLNFDCFDLLGFLSPHFVLPDIRTFASESLFSKANDAMLIDIMLQLTSVLKYEVHHFNYLALILIIRSLNSPFNLGHFFYWFLKAELHDIKIRRRFGMYLLLFLKYSNDSTRLFLYKQHHVVQSLMTIADNVRGAKKSDRLDVLRSSLKEIQTSKNKWPQKFALPLNPKLELNNIRVEKCKVMDTKKCPLWLCFINADESESEISIIFKKEDDMRQDVLVLQLFNLFDRVWRSHGLFLEMNIYKAISCGKWVGMVEVVKDSLTTAQITNKYSGNRMKFNQAFDKNVVDRFLRKKNPTDETFSIAISNFAKSLAAYCVATFVLGIGDRHSDNVMISKSGKLFHIDFGHFLGNYKYFHGIPREKAPFVFTPDFAFALGYYKKSKSTTSNYVQFVDYAVAAFKVLRNHSRIPVNALQLMIHSGLPELMSELDVEWVLTSLFLDITDDEVDVKFERLIDESLNAISTVLNNAVHMMAH